MTVYETIERPLVPVVAAMEVAGIKVDCQDAAGASPPISPAASPRSRSEIHRHRRARVQHRLAQAAGRGAVRRAEAARRQEGQDRRLRHRRRRPGGAGAARAIALPQKVLDWRQLTKLKSTYTDALQSEINPDDRARAHHLRAGASTSTGRLSSTIPTCRTSRSAPRKGARSAAPSSPSRGTSCSRSTIRRSSCASPPTWPTSRRCKRGLPRGHRHPRADREPGVRRAGRRHGPDGAPARQGDQFRHHLRHQRLRPGRAARHPAGRGARLHRAPISRAIPASATTWSGPRRSRASTGYVDDPVRPPLPHARHQRQEPGRAAAHGARRDQRAASGHRRRHHQARHDPHPARARRSAASRRACCCRCTTNWCSRCPTPRSRSSPPSPAPSWKRPTNPPASSRCR